MFRMRYSDNYTKGVTCAIWKVFDQIEWYLFPVYIWITKKLYKFIMKIINSNKKWEIISK